MIAITIIALLAAIAVPQLWRRASGYERKQFIGQLNALARFAWQRALSSNRVQQIAFDFAQRTIMLQEQSDERDSQGKKLFKPVKSVGFKTTIEIPEHLQIRQFFIEGSDAMTVFAGRPTEKVWFLVVPDGLSQRVVINMTDEKSRLADGTLRPIGLVLNPVTAQFKIYDEFQKP